MLPECCPDNSGNSVRMLPKYARLSYILKNIAKSYIIDYFKAAILSLINLYIP